MTRTARARSHTDKAREKRITWEILVDAYTPIEQAMGWYYYLENALQFPFTARCIVNRAISPFEEGRRGRVPEPLLDDLRMNALSQQQCRRGMPQVVETDRGESGPLWQRRKRLPHKVAHSA